MCPVVNVDADITSDIDVILVLGYSWRAPVGRVPGLCLLCQVVLVEVRVEGCFSGQATNLCQGCMAGSQLIMCVSAAILCQNDAG